MGVYKDKLSVLNQIINQYDVTKISTFKGSLKVQATNTECIPYVQTQINSLGLNNTDVINYFNSGV